MKLMIALTALTLVATFAQVVDSRDTPAIYIGPRRTWSGRYLQPRMAQRPRRYYQHDRRIVPRYVAKPRKYLPAKRISSSMTIRDLYNKLPYSLFQRLLANQPIRVQKSGYSGIRSRRRSSTATAIRRRRAKRCPWEKIGSPKMTLLLTTLLGYYNKAQPYTVSDVIAGSVRFCKKCNRYGCRPSHHEVSMDFSIAPTDGCTSESKCECLAVANNPGVKCTGKGVIPYGTKNLTDLVFECDGVSVLRREPEEEIEVNGSGEEIERRDPDTPSQTKPTKKPIYPMPIFFATNRPMRPTNFVGRIDFDQEDLIKV